MAHADSRERPAFLTPTQNMEKTKEEIIEEWDFFFNSHGENVDRHVLSAMQEWSDIENRSLKAENERLRKAIENILSMLPLPASSIGKAIKRECKQALNPTKD